MTLANFREITKDMPEEAELVAFNGDSGIVEEVTGLLHGPRLAPLMTSDRRIEGYVIEICTAEE